MNEKLATITTKVRHLIEHAPAGGVFHDANTHGERTLHEGFANEQRFFYLDTRDGTSYVVTIEVATRDDASTRAGRKLAEPPPEYFRHDHD